jgi:ATP-binding protein involved in chromosome partitioning
LYGRFLLNFDVEDFFMGFGWWKSTKTAEVLPTELQAVLQQFSHEALPVPLSELLIETKYSSSSIELVLPFVALGILAPLSEAFRAAGYTGTINLSVTNQSNFSFKSIRQIVLVASGKGGVGKSTTAVNLAIALAQQGAKVGLLDADIYGPSIPTMFGALLEKVQSPDNQHMQPLHKYDVFMQSIGFLVDPEQATVWRGPMASQALLQLLNETMWPELDYLIVDLPPGTGDIQLTLSQKLPVAGAVVVTTPQDVALADAKKAIAMFRQVNIPILGLVENMSFYLCKSCGQQEDIFGSRGGVALAERYQVSVLGQLPLETQIREGADLGKPIVLAKDNQTAEIYRKIARQLIFTLYWQSQLAERQQPEILLTDD